MAETNTAKTATQTQTPVMSMTAGLDIGNGDSKCKIKIGKDAPFAVDLPSVVAYTTGTNTPKIATPEYMEDFVNHLDAEVVGPGIKPLDEGRMFYGKRAISSGESLTMFNITNHVPKSQDSLSINLVDGIVAGSAVMYYYKKNKVLPKALNIVAAIGIALPIDDYINYRDSYKQVLESKTHTVTIRNFDQPIIVQVKYKPVVILAEGAAAQYAIRKLGPEFIQKALDRARSEGVNIDKAYNGVMLANAGNSIGVDIGDGTVNFTVITNRRINEDASGSINKGYGTVLDDALRDLQATTASFDTRRDLAEFLRIPPENLMPAQRSTFDVANRAVEKHKPIFARDIRTTYTDIFRKVGQRTEVIWVYGGGATPMQKVLLPVLEAESQLGDGNMIPILWMDSSYSRNLNRNGLYEAAINGIEKNL